MYEGINDATLTKPAQSIVMTDASIYYWYLRINASYSNASAVGALSAFFPQNSTTNMANYYNHPGAAAHTGGNNNLYADGHVKWLTLENQFEPTQWQL
ncbi:MAG: hypothetical protein AUJ92_19895 [Armatimonadetes bacterium CG2_30_59_28]|nr:hypothetical protein [Armatimonadota bacterium]OIO90075.1 MAG: hypothetical protein AUJ92_19895 [Armatimonadetes bacterium CG2_30_59_28]PIU60538.1 MAG: hypothetical protein COS85_24195 [Armatimonadetes bacterium CG07_land_8_20_14_0_80_59_28]PIX42458.1 MAG: hypothetical protein COZ56_09325 [Armatimonadetes bacterium CG_4_8_14_3_um_filter_58_9]PIY49573.1 MAG: hypothetical protein COZ05_00085 [Armatimonadetes bacterium CG_4_10_14_3_um_filter_59_10]